MEKNTERNTERNTEKRPDGFMVYADHLTIMKALDVEARWRLMMALKSYHECGALPEGENEVFMACFELMRGSIDRQMARYRKACERNRNSANARWNKRQVDANACEGMQLHQVDATHANQTEPNQTEPNQTEPNGTKVFDDFVKEVSFEEVYPGM